MQLMGNGTPYTSPAHERPLSGETAAERQQGQAHLRNGTISVDWGSQDGVCLSASAALLLQ
jgi:hypothetical protein